MSKAKALAAGAMVIVATAAPAFAQGKQFPDVPPDHWAAQAVKALADQGIVIGYPDGTYGGPKAMTRYEFAEAISRLLPLVTQQIQAAVANLKPPDNLVTRDQLNQILQGYVTSDALQQALQPYARLDQVYTREQADQRFALKSDVTAIQNVLDQYGKELTSLGTDVNTLKGEYAALNARVTNLEKFKVYGTGMVAWKTSEQYTGINRGQAAAGVDRDGALFDNGTFIDPTAPGAAVNPGTGKRGFFSNPSTFFDTQVGMQYASDNWRAVAEFILGNYWGAWHEEQAFNAGFADNGVGLLSNRSYASFALQPYDAYLSANKVNPPIIGSVLSDASASVGRFPTKLTKFTWWAVDPDTYLDVPREDSGNILITGGALSGKVGNFGVSVFGGYNPTDGTAPWTMQSPLDPNRNGLIGFGHYVRPGGSLALGNLTYPNMTRNHFSGDFAIPSVTSVAGARLSLPHVGFNYILGTGDDWRTNLDAAGHPLFNRTGQTYSADWNSTLPIFRHTPTSPGIGFHGEVAVSKTNNWGAFNVNTTGAQSTQGNATDWGLTFPVGSMNFALSARSISGGFSSPGYWGQLGSWVNPWNIVSDSPLSVKAGRGMNHWEVPIIPTEIGLATPLVNVPIIGDLGLTLNTGVGHLQDAPMSNGVGFAPSFTASQIGPNTGLAQVGNPRYFRISHSSAALNFGAGKGSGFKFGLSAEDVLRDYPEGGSFSRDATLIWDSIKNLVNVRGGTGSHQLAPIGVIGAAGPGAPVLGSPLQTDENYYRFSVGKALTSDGSTTAKLTLSRIVYNDRSPLVGGAQAGGGSYRGAVGTVQVTYKF